jgi:hypothetical protein
MTAKRLSLLAVVCIAAYGCSHGAMMGPRTTTAASFSVCRGAVCNVKVKVNDACEIEVDPEGLLIVKKSGDQEYKKHDIHWNLQGNYKFPDGNGIEFVNTPADVMKCKKQNDKHWLCDNAHTAGGYKYWVRVDGQCNGQPVPPRDPFVMND